MAGAWLVKATLLVAPAPDAWRAHLPAAVRMAEIAMLRGDGARRAYAGACRLRRRDTASASGDLSHGRLRIREA